MISLQGWCEPKGDLILVSGVVEIISHLEREHLSGRVKCYSYPFSKPNSGRFTNPQFSATLSIESLAL